MNLDEMSKFIEKASPFVKEQLKKYEKDYIVESVELGSLNCDKARVRAVYRARLYQLKGFDSSMSKIMLFTMDPTLRKLLSTKFVDISFEMALSDLSSSGRQLYKS